MLPPIAHELKIETYYLKLKITEMKKSLIGIICFFACVFSIRAQTLYCTTSGGGNEGGGTINK